MEPDGRRPRAAVKRESQRTLLNILTVEGVGHEKHLGFDLAVAALDGKPSRGGRVLQRLAVYRDLAMRHHRRNFGDVKLFFIFVSPRLGRQLPSALPLEAWALPSRRIDSASFPGSWPQSRCSSSSSLSEHRLTSFAVPRLRRQVHTIKSTVTKKTRMYRLSWKCLTVKYFELTQRGIIRVALEGGSDSGAVVVQFVCPLPDFVILSAAVFQA